MIYMVRISSNMLSNNIVTTLLKVHLLAQISAIFQRAECNLYSMGGSLEKRQSVSTKIFPENRTKKKRCDKDEINFYINCASKDFTYPESQQIH